MGCTSLQGAGDKGYVTGEGVVTQVDAEDRGEPVTLVGEDLDGRELSLEELRGKPVVVSVWGSWCSPCHAEAPDVVDARKELGDRASFVGIDIRDSGTAQAQAFVRKYDMDWPSYYSPDGDALLAFHGKLAPNSIPSFVVLDPAGRIAATIIGRLPSTTTLVQVVEDVIEDPGPADG